MVKWQIIAVIFTLLLAACTDTTNGVTSQIFQKCNVDNLGADSYKVSVNPTPAELGRLVEIYVPGTSEKEVKEEYRQKGIKGDVVIWDTLMELTVRNSTGSGIANAYVYALEDVYYSDNLNLIGGIQTETGWTFVLNLGEGGGGRWTLEARYYDAFGQQKQLNGSFCVTS